jgi:type I site-specific restriction-modification system R (restriction) subunit
MTGSATDPVEWQPHIRSKSGRDRIAKRFKDENDPLRLEIVRDMWLTGFDAPSLHTMYVDFQDQVPGDSSPARLRRLAGSSESLLSFSGESL